MGGTHRLARAVPAHHIHTGSNQLQGFPRDNQQIIHKFRNYLSRPDWKSGSFPRHTSSHQELKDFEAKSSSQWLPRDKEDRSRSWAESIPILHIFTIDLWRLSSLSVRPWEVNDLTSCSMTRCFRNVLFHQTVTQMRWRRQMIHKVQTYK